MTTKELIKRYDDHFRRVMNKSHSLRIRHNEAWCALTLAVVMGDRERMTNASFACADLGNQAKFSDEK